MSAEVQPDHDGRNVHAQTNENDGAQEQRHGNGPVHDHDETGAGRSSAIFEFRTVEKRKLTLSLIITIVVMVVEIVGGLLTNSMALLTDAGHMFTHSFAISISLGAILIAQRPPCQHRTFGLYRAEVIAAFINGLFLLLVVGLILYEAIERILHPVEVFGFEMLLIGLIGLATNLTSIAILHGSHKKNINVRSVFFHMVGDTASSVGLVIAAGVIHYTHWNFLDPMVSVGIAVVILVWAVGVLRESVRILLEVAPPGYDVDTIAAALKEKFEIIDEVSGAHVWVITVEMYVFYAHITLRSDAHDPTLAQKINAFLLEQFAIIESTIQIDPVDSAHICYFR